MNLDLRTKFHYVRNRLRVNTVENVIWVVNFVPKMCGFSMLEDKVFVFFWIFHFFLISYIYILGSLWYLVNYANTITEYINIYASTWIITLTLVNSYWFLMKKKEMKIILNALRKNDELVSRTGEVKKSHAKLIRNIRVIVLTFYGCIYMSEIVNYLPNRVKITDEYSITLCLGLVDQENPSKSPNREICLSMLFFQECTLMVTTLNYQAFVLLLTAHTATMYQILSQEMMELNNFETDQLDYEIYVVQKLNNLIERHSLLLDTTDKIKDFFCIPVAVNLGSNGICIMVFGFLTMQELNKFLPIVLYSCLLLFLYCHLGQRLVNAAEEFERAVYSCGWENFKLREQQMTYTMMIQSQKSVMLLAADIMPMNIATFAATCQMMYKFITVCKL